MKKIFSAVMIVIGTVIGSGFASGKEIAVFFSRFGAVSYFFIPLTFFAFLVLFMLFLVWVKKHLINLVLQNCFL